VLKVFDPSLDIFAIITIECIDRSMYRYILDILKQAFDKQFFRGELRLFSRSLSNSSNSRFPLCLSFSTSLISLSFWSFKLSAAWMPFTSSSRLQLASSIHLSTGWPSFVCITSLLGMSSLFGLRRKPLYPRTCNSRRDTKCRIGKVGVVGMRRS